MTLLRPAPPTAPGPPAPTAASGRDRAAARLRRAGLILAGLVPLAAFAVFFFLPVASLVGQGFTGPAGLDLSGFSEVLSRPRFRRILWFTVWQAAASAGLAVLLGLPGAYLLYRVRFRGQRALRAAIAVPFVLPTVVVGLAFRSLTADGGPLGGWGLDGSVWTILAAHVFLNYAVVVRTVGATWASLDRRPEDAARSLGAGPVRTWCTVTLPALGPSIAAAAVLVFLFCAASFGIILILGNSAYSTLETEIYRQTTEVLDLPVAAVLSVLQLVLVTVVLVVAGRVRRRTESTQELRTAADVQRPLRPADLPAAVVTGSVLVLLAAPVVTLVLRSLQTPDGWGVGNYTALAGNGDGRLFLITGWQALGNSLRAAVLATALAVTVGVLLSVVLARKPRETLPRRLIALMDATFMLPLGVSAVTVGFGFLIALDEPPLDLRTSPWLVPIAQALVATPLVVRLILPALRGADDRLRQAAAVLGAGPLRVWSTVDLPIMSRALAGASAFAFAIALGEFGATSFLARPETATLPVVIGRLISRPGAGNAGMAFAGGVVLAVICAASVLLVDRLGGRDRESSWGVFA
ncbi:ABC transporter permease [Nakamurella deserti]|uniref:ABC transporter permease n=1 Tax=Nakamurella deserti TaxID=2164074 RepID=UPI000DBE4028|nr:iron ABC transporter permease [Nakamurella deserti]